jgi:hypothetical protein
VLVDEQKKHRVPISTSSGLFPFGLCPVGNRPPSDGTIGSAIHPLNDVHSNYGKRAELNRKQCQELAHFDLPEGIDWSMLTDWISNRWHRDRAGWRGQNGRTKSVDTIQLQGCSIGWPKDSCPTYEAGPVCTENLSSGVVVVKPAKDGV